MKSITLITTGQPSTNPRLVKEAETLKAMGYEVHVIYCFYERWADKYDPDIIRRNADMYTMCGGHPIGSKFLYYKTRVRQKICSFLFRFIKARLFAANALSRTYRESLAVATRQKSDLYIAHNLGALPAAVKAAAQNNAKTGYDAEDMDSGQFTSQQDAGYDLAKYIEQNYFPCVNYFTAASPLIAASYKKIYGYLAPIVINNVFPVTNLTVRPCLTEPQPLKLFWFSQTIGPNRGLEGTIEAIALTGRDISFHLLGQCTSGYREFITTFSKCKGLKNSQINIYGPVSPEKIFEIAPAFDIGMASEQGSPLNRDICLTNKVFTYIQCGLAIVASDTQAQALFLSQYPSAGLLYDKNNIEALAGCLKIYDDDRQLLYQTKQSNRILGQTKLNWENESLKFMRLIKDLER